MFEKYVVISASEIVAKQSSNGIWYCSELPAKDTKELEDKIGEVNRILNKYNVDVVKRKEEKEVTAVVKGLMQVEYGRRIYC